MNIKKSFHSAMSATVCVIVLASPAAAQAQSFRVPAGDLKVALDSYARQSGEQILYRLDQLGSVRSKGVNGAMTADAALRQLLAGTGLEGKRDRSGAIAIVPGRRPEAMKVAYSSMADQPERNGAISEAAPAVSANAPGEIIVTARRVNESLQRVPIAITALRTEQLTARSLNSETDLQRSVAGLTVRTGQNNNYFTFSIRGQTPDLYAGSRPAVLPYVNDIQATAYGTSSFYDLESIQVLKGPQGTLFGRNTTGGAVLFSTAKPTNELGGFITGRIGNYDLREVLGAVNIPIVDDKILLRVAGDIAHRDGYQYNIYLNTAHGKVERQSGRVSLTLKPSDRLENTTVFDYSHAGGDNVQLEMDSVYPCGSTNNGIILNTTAACLYGPDLDKTFGPGAYDAYRALHPKAQPGGILEQVDFQKELGPWRVNTLQPSIHRARSWSVSNATALTLNDDLQLKNIFGASRASTYDWFDSQGTGPYFLQSNDSAYPSGYGGPLFGATYRSRQWSDEVQLIGKGFGGSLDYILGLYASRQNESYFAPVSFVELMPFIPKTLQVNDFATLDKTQAFYIQGTQDLSNMTGVAGLSATGGIRYTWEQIRLKQGPRSTQFGLANAPVNPADINEKAKFSNPSWTIGLQYQVDPSLMLYVAQRGSWRSGGFNGYGPARLATAKEGGNLFKSETTKDIELGAKYGGNILGMRSRLNIALYNQWIKNVQRVVYTTPTSEYSIGGIPSLNALTVNIPKSRVRGFEIDSNLVPASWLELGATLAYTDAKFTNGTTLLFGNSISYGPYADTPKWAGSAFAAVTLPTPEDWGKLVLRGDVYAQSGQYYSNLAATVAPDTRIPGYKLVNMRLDFTDIGGSPLSLAAFVKNVAKATNYSGGISLGSVFGQNGVLPGEPRTYGLEVTARF